MPNFATPRTLLYKAPRPQFGVIDVPIHQEGEENTIGVYVVTRLPVSSGRTQPAVVYVSRDGGVTYHSSVVIEDHAITGKLAITGAGGLLVANGADLATGTDKASVALIKWSNDYAPATITDAELLNGRNALFVGGEILQFKTAGAASDRSSWLTELLRGRRGTEYKIADVADGAAVVVLNDLPFVKLRNSDIGKTLFFKCITSGMSLDDSQVVFLEIEGNTVKPFAPSNVTGTRNAAQDCLISWNRRARAVVRLMGVKWLPYGEDAEQYEVDILSRTIPRTVLRTIQATSTSVTYTAAEQTADGLTLGAEIPMRIYQMSNATGRGQTNTIKVLASSTPNFTQKSEHTTT